MLVSREEVFRPLIMKFTSQVEVENLRMVLQFALGTPSQEEQKFDKEKVHKILEDLEYGMTKL